MLDIIIMRGDNGQEAVLKLPNSFDESEETLSALEAVRLRDATAAIISADTLIKGLDRILPSMEIDEQELNELGFLSRRIGRLCDRGRNILTDILELEPSKSLRGIVNLSCNLYKFERLPGVKDAGATGRHLLREHGADVPDSIADYIACDRVANKYLANHPGVFIDSGFVFKRDGPLEIVYDGGKLPRPYYNPNGIITIRLSHKGKPSRVALAFPATEKCIEAVLVELGVKDLEDYCTSCTSSVPGSLERLSNYNGLECLNLGAAHAGILEEQYRLFMAVTEAEIPGSMFELPETVGTLCQYHLLPEDIKTPEDYVRYLMDEEGICCMDGITARFVNSGALGKVMMKEDGAVLTSFDIVEWYDYPIQ